MNYFRFIQCVCLIPVLAVAAPPDDGGQVAVTAQKEAVEVSRAGVPALRYLLEKPADSACTSPSACYFHPLTTPSGLTVTDVAPDDHLHHRGVFLAWLEVRNDAGEGDFWGWGKHAALENRRLVHRSVEDVESTSDRAAFSAVNSWRAGELTLLEETLRSVTVFREDMRIHDMHYLFAAGTETVLGQHAFSGFSVRLRKDFPIVIHDPSGKIDLPQPSHLKPESNWPDRPWYAFEMTLPSGEKAGVAVLNHPDNPTTTWHNVARIGLINPCIVAPSAVTIPGGDALSLRYRVVTFDGPVPTATLDELAGDMKSGAASAP
ncbi:MAG: hypothetical protein GXX91_14660 [Verrucomicrobiaceae bacterium]|nr:hypothetical protein [Verrucomicrobiaceae bacterium]